MMISGSNILVVDDDALNRVLLATSLEEEGYSVETAEDGGQALVLLKSRPFDLVLLDLLMPEMDGYQVLEQMKCDSELRHLPVIVISALDDMESIIRCIEMGATDYLPKPFDPVLLRARVNASLAQKRLLDMEKSYVKQIHRVSARFRAIFDWAAIGVGLLDGQGHSVESNPALQRMLGYSQEALKEMSFTEYTHPEDVAADASLFRQLMDGERDSYQIEKRFLCKDGHLMWGRQTVSLVQDAEGSSQFAIGMVEAVTERKRAEEELKYLSVHDPLTDLCNRAYFEQEMLRLENSRQYPLSVFMVDVDHLKETNDYQGHAAGDQLLQRTAAVLKAAFREEDVIARIGGDEFAVLLPSTDSDAAAAIMQRVRDRLRAHNASYQREPLSFSIGAATAEMPELPLVEVLNQADERMYEEKMVTPGRRR